MVSTYGYITQAQLEAYAVLDYSAADSAITDAIVDAKISDAEVFVNTYVGTTFSGTIPPGISLVTKMIAKIFMDNHMIEQKIGTFQDQDGIIVNVLERYDIVLLLEQYKNEYGAEQGVFISKHTHLSPYRDIQYGRPTGW